MRIEEALERFLVQLQADGRSPHTIGQYRRHVRLLARWARDVGPRCDRIEDLDHEAIAGFLASPVANRRPDGKAKLATSMNALRTSIRVFTAYCHKGGFIAQDPGRLVRRANCSPPPPRALSDDEERKLLAVLAKAEGFEARRDEALVLLMLSTGVRIGAALAIHIEDIDIMKAEISIHTKGNRRAKIYLGRKIQAHIRRYMRHRASGPLFPTRDGQPISRRHAERRFRSWIAKAGVRRPASPHSLRHTFALNLYEKTGDVLLVREALCHRSISSTMVYARADAERLRRALRGA
jgi:site-specific recombinase XerC